MIWNIRYTFPASASPLFCLLAGRAAPQKAVVYISRFKCCKINYDYCRVGGNGELIVALSQAADSRCVTTNTAHVAADQAFTRSQMARNGLNLTIYLTSNKTLDYVQAASTYILYDDFKMLGYGFAWPFEMYAVSIYVLCFGVSTGEYSVAHYFMGNLLHCIYYCSSCSFGYCLFFSVATNFCGHFSAWSQH